MAVLKDLIEDKLMVLMMAAWKDSIKADVKAASMVELTVLLMVGKLVARMVA